MNRRSFVLAGLACALLAAPAAAQSRFAPTRFSVVQRGAGPDVLLIPGLTSGRQVWQSTAAAIPGYRYHLLQVAGFAGDPARGNAEGPVLSPLAEEIIRYIETRGLRRPAIVGHSMGGTLAMLIALRRPELVSRIMVVDMLPQPAGLFGGTASGWAPLAQSLATMMGSRGGRQLFANLMGAFSPPNGGARGSDPHVVGRLTQELVATDLTPRLSRLRTPLTVVYASPDPRARAAIDRQFASGYAAARGARLIRVEDSGHLVMLDQPARFQAELRQFLGR